MLAALSANEIVFILSTVIPLIGAQVVIILKQYSNSHQTEVVAAKTADVQQGINIVSNQTASVAQGLATIHVLVDGRLSDALDRIGQLTETLKLSGVDIPKASPPTPPPPPSLAAPV